MKHQKKTGTNRTGRSAAVREWLAGHHGWHSAREILEAIEPEGDITLMCATLGTLYRHNAVLKDGIGQGNVKWKHAPRPAQAPSKRGASMKATATKHVRARTVAPAALVSSRGIARPVTAIASRSTAAPASRRESVQRTNFTTPMTSVDRLRPRGPERESVEAFLRRGGAIQRLSVFDCSQPLKATLEAIRASTPRSRKSTA